MKNCLIYKRSNGVIETLIDNITMMDAIKICKDLQKKASLKDTAYTISQMGVRSIAPVRGDGDFTIINGK